jgi:predicted Holliday junction resolvase-like endonuclease
MNAIKLKLKIESDTLKIPELSRFIGKSVELILLEDESTGAAEKNKFLKIKKLKGSISFDRDAVSSLRDNSKL